MLGVTEPEDRAQGVTQVCLRTLGLPGLERERVKASTGTIPKILTFNIGCSLHSAPPSLGSFATGISSCPACVQCCHSVISDSLQHYGRPPAKLLCPWDSLGKSTGVGCWALLQGIFLTQGPKPGIKPTSLTFPALAGRFFTTSVTWEPKLPSIPLLIGLRGLDQMSVLSSSLLGLW